MAWRLAKSLETLRAQVNALFPGRDKSSDGTIGDEAHASRSSDHNPWVTDGKTGVVTACDISHDPDGGVDCALLAGVLVASRDPRIKYIIFNRRIVSGELGPAPWEARPYNGANPHDKHMHVSVKPSKLFYDDTERWAMPGGLSAEVPLVPAPAPARPTLLRGSTGAAVKDLQKLLGFPVDHIDGMFGPVTEAEVKARQRKAGIVVDGKVGPYTWAALAA